MADRIASVNQYVVSPCGQQALNCGKCARAQVLTVNPSTHSEPWLSPNPSQVFSGRVHPAPQKLKEVLMDPVLLLPAHYVGQRSAHVPSFPLLEAQRQLVNHTKLVGLSTGPAVCRVAPDESMLGNATVLAAVLPTVDAIIQTVQYNATNEIITFSASMDPGALPHERCGNFWQEAGSTFPWAVLARWHQAAQSRSQKASGEATDAVASSSRVLSTLTRTQL